MQQQQQEEYQHVLEEEYKQPEAEPQKEMLSFEDHKLIKDMSDVIESIGLDEHWEDHR